MKLFALAIVFVSSAAFAQKTYQMIGGVPANNLCDAGSVFKTVKPVTVCTEWKEIPGQNQGEIMEPSQWVCVSSQLQQLSVSKETTVCLQYVTNEFEHTCVKWGKGVQSNNTVTEEVTYHGDISEVKYGTYTIPACK